MRNAFWQQLADLFGRLRGKTLVAALGVWIVLFAVALSCATGVIGLPAGMLPAQATSTPTAEPTPTPGALLLPTPTPMPDESFALPQDLPPLPWGDFGYGIAAHIYEPDVTMYVIRNQLRLTWVKQQIRWDHFSEAPGQMDWSAYDPVVEAAAENGLKLMLSVVGAPDWSRSYFDSDPETAPPDDLSLFVAFLGELVDRYKGRVHAIEVWNEQNLDREWDTAEGVSARRYVEMLRLSYQAIKARDPNIVVISGALSPTGVMLNDPENPNRPIVIDDRIYFQQMIDEGFLSYADCVGAHHNGINMPPDVAWDEGYNNPEAQFRGPFDSPHPSWSFKSTLWGYHEMIKQAGFSTPLCVTEFGWATAEGFSAYPPGFGFSLDNTLEQQALWNVQAFQLMRQWGFVHLAFLWNYDYSVRGGSETDPNAPYSIVDMSGAPRPAFWAIADMPKTP